VAASFVGVHAAYSTGSNTLTITKPTDTADGDILLALVKTYRDAGVTAITHPDTWAEIATIDATPDADERTAIAWKRASSEGASWAWATAAAADDFQGYVVAYRGFLASGSPIHASSNTKYNTSNTTIRAATLTTTVPTWLIWMGKSYSGTLPTLTSPGGYTERLDLQDLASRFLCDKDCSAWTGETGSVDGTLSQTTTDKHAFLVALQAAAITGLWLPAYMDGGLNNDMTGGI
jgi:hypothetical protein